MELSREMLMASDFPVPGLRALGSVAHFERNRSPSPPHRSLILENEIGFGVREQPREWPCREAATGLFEREQKEVW